jgi:hypothetical protein
MLHSYTPALLSRVLFAVLIGIGLSGFTGCSGGNDSTVIAPTENFQEEAAVAEEKAKAMAESQKEPL